MHGWWGHRNRIEPRALSRSIWNGQKAFLSSIFSAEPSRTDSQARRRRGGAAKEKQPFGRLSQFRNRLFAIRHCALILMN